MYALARLSLLHGLTPTTALTCFRSVQFGVQEKCDGASLLLLSHGPIACRVRSVDCRLSHSALGQRRVLIATHFHGDRSVAHVCRSIHVVPADKTITNQFQRAQCAAAADESLHGCGVCACGGHVSYVLESVLVHVGHLVRLFIACLNYSNGFYGHRWCSLSQLARLCRDTRMCAVSSIAVVPTPIYKMLNV